MILDSFRLDGKVALVTGSSRGLGQGAAVALAEAGADIALLDRGDASATADLVEATGRRVHRVQRDLVSATPDELSSAVDEVIAELGGLDILVNNAGKQTAVERIEDLADDQFEATFRTNVFAPFWLIKAAVPHLPKGATIINTASLEAYKPAPDRLDYAATKAAINNLSKGLAQQLAPRGIRVNVVAPGPTWTALQVSDGVSDEQMTAFDDENEYQRAGQPAEIAPAFVFLASAESGYVSGETLNVNGGMVTP